VAYNILRIKEVAEGNLGKSLISLLSAVVRPVRVNCEAIRVVKRQIIHIIV